MRAILPTTGIAAIRAVSGLRARPARGVALGSFAELSRQKIVFDFQLADLPVQNIDLRLVGGALRHAAALENAGGAIRSEEHTSELQSQFHLVCRLLLEK